jgi:hypothetical protein
MKRRLSIKAQLTWVVIEPMTTYADPEALCRVNEIGLWPFSSIPRCRPD